MMALLNNEEIARYSRQMILDEIGKEGQLKLKSTKVLIVGCGGLGCPCSLYLVAAGIGKLGLLDCDKVEISNLHRQVLHSEATVSQDKTQSAFQTLNQLNSNVEYELHNVKLSPSNALSIVEKYDIVVDATDNAATRYLVNDACVLRKKPLVSGAALRFEGQLTIYNYNDKTPCYRCLFPTPPPAGTITNCSDGGVMGVVPGIVGSLQALEVIKIAVGREPSFCGQMLLFDALNGTFNKVKIRGKLDNCQVCGTNATIDDKLMDYDAFCGVNTCGVKLLKPEERIDVSFYKKEVLDKNKNHLLIDVRPSVQAGIVKFDNAISIPLKDIVNGNGCQQIEQLMEEKKAKTVYFICRRGNASQKAVYHIKQNNLLKDALMKDIIGGITQWSKEIDPSVPLY